MNRTDYMRAVYATDLDQVSKTILVYLGFRKNWKNGTMAFPSHAAIAADTGLGARTVKRKVPELRARGYLRDTGRRVGRGVIVYDLNDPTSATEAPQERHRGTAQCQSGTAAVPKRHTEQVREPVREPVLEQVHTAPVVADAPTVTVEREASLSKEDGQPSMGTIWVSDTGDVLFEADTGSGVYMLSDSGVGALSLPETRTAAPVTDPAPIPSGAATPSPLDRELAECRRRWAMSGETGWKAAEARLVEEKAIQKHHGVTADAW